MSGLTEDRRILRALEGWHRLSDWWRDMGRKGSRKRWSICACRVGRSKGWAEVRLREMPDYRWAFYLRPARTTDHPFGITSVTRVQEVPASSRHVPPG